MKVPWNNPFKPSPAPPSFGEGHTLPQGSASLLSKLVFYWLNPFLEVGFSRPLEKEDLWELPNARLTSTITDDLTTRFYNRCPPEKRPRFMREGIKEEGVIGEDTDEKAADEKTDETKIDLEDLTTNEKKGHIWFRRSKKPARKKPKYDGSLFKAIHQTFFYQIWFSGILKLISDTLKTTTPLLNKVILTWLTESYIYYRLSNDERSAAAAQGFKKPNGIGYGIGLAIGLFAMQEVASLMTNHYMQTSMAVGLSVRTGIIGSVFRKSLRLSGRGRVNHSVGQITTMISTDSARLDRFSAFGHNLWVSPIQLAIGVGLLIGNLGYSALVGLGVLILGFPLQIMLVRVMFNQRKKGVKLTDKRVRLTTEVLQGIRLIKLYAWEDFYTQQIGNLRSKEISTIRKSAVARSTIIGLMTFIPILASVLSFITYGLSGHDLNVAVIFSSLQLFNIIRMPLIFFPIVLVSLTDAMVALGRIGTFLTAEELDEPYKIQDDIKLAVEVDGDFAWETVLSVTGKGAESKFAALGAGKGGAAANRWSKRKSNLLPATTADVNPGDEKPKEKEKDEEEKKPFELNNLQFRVPKGAFVGIVGRVGSGKSSLLQALIGEMRRTRGEITFGGSVAYAPQTPWIRNSTLRENVLFGQEHNEERFREVISACSLDHDLEVLPHGEDTEIGEKGINLSGGQKARVSLARAAYSQSDIVLLDDPLSAVDAYVGKDILDNCLLKGPLANRTRILVTHALHVLDKTDYIYVMDGGVIIEQGTYEDLTANSVVFSHLIEEYGSMELEEELNEASPAGKRSRKTKGFADESAEDEVSASKRAQNALMQMEERITGSVTWDVYRKYLKFAGGIVWAPTILLLLTVTQGAQVANNLFLGFWTANSIPSFRQADYMAVYASLGVAQAVFTFLVSAAFALASLIAGLNLFKAALRGVLRSPASFFDTTPMGRILSRLSKDQDTLDTQLSMTLFQFLNTFSSVLGTVGLVFYTFPYLGIIFAPMTVLYWLVSMFYRRSSVETKRLDSLMRSALYASYSETLTGLSTIRAYREQNRAVKDAEKGLDMENRAYYMTISIQRWLAVRLDLFGNVLILGIGLFAAGFRHTVNPAKIGVVLSYTLSITQIFSDMVSQFAENEQNMNAVERVLHYSELLPEGEFVKPDDPPPSWPSEGMVTFSDVEMAYRPGLPLVLKGISFQVKPGEKVGIVGRTGAGKSSLLQALFRTVELQRGTIDIDGVDIRNVGLDTLRWRLALVPQDSTLFLGTLRENLDPQALCTDAELISVLQRAWLLPRDGAPTDPVADAKFSLNATVGDEGSNYSAGEKQLLALCRALVKNSRIIVLDEATSSVDVETDAKLQRTIQTEFGSSTLLCIAHRLNTIAYYDRVIVMDGGKVAEFDTVLNLFDEETSIFRSLCDEANLQRADIVRIRAENGVVEPREEGKAMDEA